MQHFEIKMICYGGEFCIYSEEKMVTITFAIETTKKIGSRFPLIRKDRVKQKKYF